jgi:hypothetical protein
MMASHSRCVARLVSRYLDSCLWYPYPRETVYWAYGFMAMLLLIFGGDTLYPCLSLFAMKSVLPENQVMGAARLSDKLAVAAALP